jgi:hypothetical protein
MTSEFQNQKQPNGINNLGSHEAKEVVDYVVQKFDSLKEARHEKEKKWTECIKAFLSQHNHGVSDVRKWRSQIYIPLSYEAATNIYSNLKRSLFPTDSAFFTVEGVTSTGAANANILKTFLLYQLDEMGFITKFGNFLKQLVITGNSAAAVYWKKITREVREEDRGDVGEKLIYDGPEFEVINMFDIVFEPDVADWRDGVIIHRTYRTLEQVHNNPVYKNTAALVATDRQLDPNILEASQAFGMPEAPCGHEGMVLLYSAYGDFKIGEKVYYDHIAVVANNEHLIRFEPNPYPDKPFVFCTYENVPGELYGIGVIEPGLGIQYLVNSFSNQKSDVMSLIINGMWAYVDDGILDPEEIVARPGALIPVKDPNNIRPLHPDKNVLLSYNEIAQLKAEYQEVTGATKYFTGAQSVDFRKTATEVAALQQAGLVRFSEVIQNIEENALKRAIKLIHKYNGNFLLKTTESQFPDKEENEFVQIPYAAMLQRYDFRIIGANSSISKDIRVNKLLEFIKIAASSPALAGQINLLELVKGLYREFGFKDEKNIFLPQSFQFPMQ